MTQNELPEQKTVAFAGFWIRVLAQVTDLVVLYVLGFLVGLVGGLAGVEGGIVFLVFLIGIGYYVILTGSRGQTLGKMVWGIIVINATGDVPGYGRAFLREVIGKFISGIAISIGYLWIAYDEQRRAWHDKIANTYVVQEAERPPIGQPVTGIALGGRRPLWLVIGLAVVIVPMCISLPAAVLLPALARAREEARISNCAINLKQVGAVLEIYADDTPSGKLPPKDENPTNFIVKGSAIFPEYLDTLAMFGCPSDPGFDPDTSFRDSARGLQYSAELLTDESYIYFGWQITNEEEGLAALEAYRKLSPGNYDADLSVEPGEGNNGSSVIARLYSPHISRPGALSAASEEIPVMWDRCCPGLSEFNHVVGGNVLFLDGHVEFISYPGKFPMTECFVRAMCDLERGVE